jgi:branched-chain amino acid transport system permease protein
MTGRKILLLVLLAALAVPPFAGINSYWLHVLNVTWVFAIAALGLNLVTGVTGQIVLGQAALMGIGAYTAGLLMVKLQWPWFAAAGAALAVAVVVGVALGLLSMRIKGHYLAITTLALNEIFRQVVLNQANVTGGPMGLRDIPTFALPFWSGDTDRQAYLPLLVAMVAAFALALVLYRRRLGRQMRAVRDDELAAESMGVDSRKTKIRAFVLCSFFGAVAGVLYVFATGFVSPNNFTIFESIRLILMTVIGGLGSIGGTVIGAALVTLLPEVFRDLQEYYMAAFAVAVLAVLLLEPRGLGVLGDWLLAPWLPQQEKGREPGALASLQGQEAGVAEIATATGAVVAPGPGAPVLLQARGVSKHFGGVYALQDVSFDVREGEILGVIGPNGSGKSTFINICSGIIRADAGTMRLGSEDIARLPAWDIHARGVARIFQNVRLWESMTVLENVMLAWRGAGSDMDAERAARQALDGMGIAFLAHRRAADLSFGQSRLVELARATVNKPRLLLLDEPAAGLRGGLVMELAGILQRLRAQGTTVLVVEHRIKLVMAMCDRVVVLNLGEKIAEGRPDEIQKDARVVEAYLGERAGYDADAAPAAAMAA